MCKTNDRHETKSLILHQVLETARHIADSVKNFVTSRRKIGLSFSLFLYFTYYSRLQKVPYYSKRNSRIMCVSLIGTRTLFPKIYSLFSSFIPQIHPVILKISTYYYQNFPLLFSKLSSIFASR